MAKKRYVVCGVSGRAIGMFIRPMVTTFSHCAEFVGMLDIDPLRFKVCRDRVAELQDMNIPEYTVTLENWKESQEEKPGWRGAWAESRHKGRKGLEAGLLWSMRSCQGPRTGPPP